MGLADALIPNIDLVAFVIFLVCITISMIARGYAERRKTRRVASPDVSFAERYPKLFVHKLRLAEATENFSGKAVREAYRRNWIEHMIANKQYAEIRETARNNLMSSTAIISVLVVVLGFLVSQYWSIKQAGVVPNAELKFFTVTALLFYALYMLITQIRTLMYLPIMGWVDEELVQTIEGTDKVDYISRMVELSYDHFSNSNRAIFYAICCSLWFIDPVFFIASSLALTGVYARDDFEQHRPMRERMGLAMPGASPSGKKAGGRVK